MGGSCSTYLRKRDHLEEPGIDGRILRWICWKWDGWGGRSIKGIDLAQDKDRWQALVNAVMNLQVLYSAGNFLTENCLAAQEEL
jgi:hypothetical protein